MILALNFPENYFDDLPVSPGTESQSEDEVAGGGKGGAAQGGGGCAARRIIFPSAT